MTKPFLRLISLGAGVQSTTMALMAAHGEVGPMPDGAIFADTGSEPRATYPKPPKSACTFCPFHSDAEWRAIRADPADWAQALEVDRQIRGTQSGYARDLKFMPYLHSSLKPLDEVDLRTDEEAGQPDLFNNECEGMCGV